MSCARQKSVDCVLVNWVLSDWYIFSKCWCSFGEWWTQASSALYGSNNLVMYLLLSVVLMHSVSYYIYVCICSIHFMLFLSSFFMCRCDQLKCKLLCVFAGPDSWRQQWPYRCFHQPVLQSFLSTVLNSRIKWCWKTIRDIFHFVIVVVHENTFRSMSIKSIFKRFLCSLLPLC